MRLRNLTLALLAFATVTFAQSDAAFQVRYAANLNYGDSHVVITNDGANGAPALGPGFGSATGNICVNVYAFDPNEELISCCSCLVTPDQTVSLSVITSILDHTETGVVPNSLTIKLLATQAGATSCSNSAAVSATPVNGMTAWGTTLHYRIGNETFDTTETPFTPATLSAGEQASIVGRCASIVGNASGYGICKGCIAGANAGFVQPF